MFPAARVRQLARAAFTYRCIEHKTHLERWNVVCRANDNVARGRIAKRRMGVRQPTQGTGAATIETTAEENAMKVSARNTLPGVIRKIEPGAVNAEVTLELGAGIIIVSIITLDAVKSLGLKVGQKAYAVIKSSSVMVGVD